MNPKVTAAGVGGGVAGSLTVILVWVVGMAGLDVPPEVASAFTTLVTAVAAIVAGYLKPSRATGA